MIDLVDARKAFENYLNLFQRADEKINLKIVHTDGVVRCASRICRRMKLGEEDCSLAELIALLHDIGRFEQLRMFDSFEPSVMNHAEFGAELLFGEQQMIRRFVQEDTWDSIIYQAILRHSDYAVGDGLDKREMLHACIIRDADKLDNCRVKLEDKIEILLGCAAEEAGRQEISPEVWKECTAGRSVHLEKRKTKIDYWVSYIAYFFDICFPATSEIILENDYVEKIIRRLPYGNEDTEKKMWVLYEMVTDYLKRKIKEDNKSLV